MAFVIDVDSHVYEPPEIWDRYVAEEFRGMARSAFYHEVDDEGNRLTIVNGASGKDLNRSRLVRQAIWRPGDTVDDIGALDPDVYVPINPGAYDPTARLELYPIAFFSDGFFAGIGIFGDYSMSLGLKSNFPGGTQDKGTTYTR
jgi:hypothetical protein